jgi:hypothetical protein
MCHDNIVPTVHSRKDEEEEEVVRMSILSKQTYVHHETQTNLQIRRILLPYFILGINQTFFEDIGNLTLGGGGGSSGSGHGQEQW